MKRMSIVFTLLLAVIIPLSLTGCGSESKTTNDSIEIYQVIIRNVYLNDNSFGKPVDIKYLYILKDTDDGIGDSEITQQPSQKITDEVMDGISSKLSDLPPKITWINSYDEVLNKNVSLSVEDGAIVTLGNIGYENDTKAYVSIGIYFSGLAGLGRTYILEKDKETWKIIGDTGGGWVS